MAKYSSFRKMIRYIACLIGLTCLSNCKSPSSEKALSADTTNSVPPDTITRQNQTWLDSIDRENAERMAGSDSDFNKAYISRSDSTIWVAQNKYQDHRIFGYQKPDTSSKRMILISVFTNDVEGNPFKCPLGSYYDTASMEDMTLKYLATEGQFIKVNVIKTDGMHTIVYIEKKWTELE
jgi:hypothetical protein